MSIAGTVNDLGGELDIQCDPPAAGSSTASCLFKQTTLVSLFGSNGLALQDCEFGECVQQYVIDQAQGIIGSSGTSSSGLSAGVIAGLAVVGAIILLALLVFLWGIFLRRKAKKRPYIAGSDKGRGASLEWTGIGYQVGGKSGVNAALTKFRAWAKGTGVGKGRGHADGKVVLDGVSGKMPVGGFCCVLGPSGECERQ